MMKVKVYSRSFNYVVVEREMNELEIKNLKESLLGKNFRIEIGGKLIQDFFTDKTVLSFSSYSEPSEEDLDRIINKLKKTK